MHQTNPASADPLLDLLSPFWQGLIGACVVLTFAVAAARLARRGRSRMGTAMLVVGATVVAITVVGALAQR
jgi:hypothetical protein